MSSNTRDRLLVAMDQKGCRDLEGDAVLASAMAEKLFGQLSESGGVVALREIFGEALESYNDMLGVQAVNRWAVSYAASNAEGQIDAGMFACLTVMFWDAHAKYRGGAYPMGKTLLAVFAQILALWRPRMSETSVAAFEFCAAATQPMNGSEYEDWTGAMKEFRGKHVHKEDRAAMEAMIRDKANTDKGGLNRVFDERELAAWNDRYANVPHFSLEVLTILRVAHARKCSSRDEAVRREVCGDITYLNSSGSLRRLLVSEVKKGMKFDELVRQHLRQRIMENTGFMQHDEPGKFDKMYGRLHIEYESFTKVRVDVLLPPEMPEALRADMLRRAKYHAGQLHKASGEEVSVVIFVFWSDQNVDWADAVSLSPLCMAKTGKEGSETFE